MKELRFLFGLLIAASVLSAGLPAIAGTQGSALSAEELKVSGDSLLRNGRVPAAIEAYENALLLDPSFKEVYFNLAVARFTSRSLKEARLCLEKLLILDPNDSETAYNLACLYLYEKETLKARLLLMTASASCPEKADYKPLIQNTLGFLDQLALLDPQTQEIVLTRIISNALYPSW